MQQLDLEKERALKPTMTWILVADGAHARIYENLGPGKGLREIPGEALEQSIPPTRDLGTDRPGRVSESVGGARHGMTRVPTGTIRPRRTLQNRSANVSTPPLSKKPMTA